MNFSLTLYVETVVDINSMTIECPVVVASSSEFTCNSSILSGTYMETTVNWNDGTASETFPIAGEVTVDRV